MTTWPGSIVAYKHGEKGRWCTLSADGMWRYWPSGNIPGGLICRLPHPSQEERQVEVDSDRGEFGYPAIGVGGFDWINGGSIKAEDITGRVGVALRLRAEPTTDDAKYILQILPSIIDHFMEKNTQYARAQTGHDLGVKGIIPDINRKSSALISMFWDRDGEAVNGGDEAEELIDDLIGHLLLMRAKLRDR